MPDTKSPSDAEAQTLPAADNEIETMQVSNLREEMTLGTEDVDEQGVDVQQRRKHLLFRLYISHFLSTWNARLFEFGAVLFLAAIYPNTLQPLSIYALVRSAAAVCFSQAVGEWIDHGDRLRVMRFSIIGQRISVAASCAIFLVLYMQAGSLSYAVDSFLFALVVLLSCIEKLCFIMNTVSLERDWIVVITDGQESRRRVLNARTRRIDLICKTVAPLVIALIDGFSTIGSISTAGGLTILSVGVEYFSIAQVYKLCPALKREDDSDTANDSARTRSQQNRPIKTILLSALHKIAPIKAIPSYFTHSAFMPSFSLALLYLTVLSFSGQMITFLKAMGYSSIAVGAARTIATILELSATWLAPFLITRIGATRTGLWSIYWQMVCLAAAVAWYFSYGEGHEDLGNRAIRAVTGLSVAVGLSRVGLWGFDLAAQFIIQEEVQSDNRGAFSATEASFQNLFELISFALTIAFPRPDQFQWPMVVSVATVFLAGGLYTAYLRKKRGHLLHAPMCCKGEIDR